MSNDDVPEDGEVRSFRSRRRTRRGKRRSLRVPVDEVPRRSAADDVSSDMPPAITHPMSDIESEVTQPGSIPAPMMTESVETEIEAELDSALETEIEAELTSDVPTQEEAPEASSAPPADDSVHPSSPPAAAQPASASPSAHPSSRPASAHPSSRPASVHPPSARAPARPSSISATKPEGSPSKPYVPPPPGVPRDLKLPEPAEPPAPVAASEEAPAAPRSQAPRRDSVVVRGTVRVSDLPEKRRVPATPTSDAPDAKAEAAEEPQKSPFEAAITSVIDAREELEELDASELEALESVRPEPETGAPAAELEADEGPITGELLEIEEAEDEARASEPTAVAEPPSAALQATETIPAEAPPADEDAEISIEDASTEDLEAFGLGAEELELEIDEEEPADVEEEAEELELSEEAAIEDEAVKPVSHPPPTPAEPTPAAAQAQPTEPKEPAPAAEPAAEPRPRRRRKPWWEDFFNDDYLRTVRPYPLKYVRRQCDFIESQLGLERGATILDVGCGLGLQAVELASRGYLVVGLDLSLPMLSRAADEAQDRGLKINFLHGDMREMTFDGAFDAVLCWGTTLGYFDEETNRKVIERLYRALKPMGLLLIDAVNRDHVIRYQPNLVWFEGDGCVCMEETQFNYITSRLEVKRTVILDDGRQRENVYSIRLYSLNEIGQLLHHQGFRVAQVSGHEAHPGVFFGADSPRLIIMAERRLAKGSRDTPKEGTARAEPAPAGEKQSEGEEIAELEIEPEETG